MPVVMENSCLKYVINDQGLNTSFVDLASGLDYCQSDPPGHGAPGGDEGPSSQGVLRRGAVTCQRQMLARPWSS